MEIDVETAWRRRAVGHVLLMEGLGSSKEEKVDDGEVVGLVFHGLSSEKTSGSRAVWQVTKGLICERRRGGSSRRGRWTITHQHNTTAATLDRIVDADSRAWMEWHAQKQFGSLLKVEELQLNIVQHLIHPRVVMSWWAADRRRR